MSGGWCKKRWRRIAITKCEYLLKKLQEGKLGTYSIYSWGKKSVWEVRGGTFVLIMTPPLLTTRRFNLAKWAFFSYANASFDSTDLHELDHLMSQLSMNFKNYYFLFSHYVKDCLTILSNFSVTLKFTLDNSISSFRKSVTVNEKLLIIQKVWQSLTIVNQILISFEDIFRWFATWVLWLHGVL